MVRARLGEQAIADLSSDERSLLLAHLAAAAYRDEVVPELDSWGFQTHATVDPDPEFLTRAVVATNDLQTVVAIRGTARFELESGPEKWTDFFRGWTLNLSSLWGTGNARALSPSYNGLVHQGFARIATSIQADIVDALDDLPRDRPVYLCGHSQGGAVATLLGQPLNDAGIAIRATYTFGAPRAGDELFADSYPGTVLRHENADDLVCLVPPGWLSKALIEQVLALMEIGWRFPDASYKHAGRLRFFHWDGPDRDRGRLPALQRARRMLSVGNERWRRRKLLGDHRVPCYLSALLSRHAAHVQGHSHDPDSPKLDQLAARITSESDNLQQLLDAMEEVAIEGEANDRVYASLESVALRDTSALSGQLKDDWDYLRQAAIWTAGMLSSPTLGLRPFGRCRGYVSSHACSGTTPRFQRAS